jgi:hypothetical protein
VAIAELEKWCLIDQMIKKAILLMCFAGVGVNAQTITQTFGSGANAFSIDFVQIGNPGNAPDTTGNPNPAGSVSYIYNIGKYEISRDMIDKANLAGALGITMYDMTAYTRNGPNTAVSMINWYKAAKFVNYLNTSTGNSAAYKFDANGTFQLWAPGDTGYNAKNLYRNNLAHFFLPSIDEWYKAAYGSPENTWYKYAAGSDNTPVSVSGGTISGTAVYGQGFYDGPADVTNAGGLNAHGVMAMGGNVNEWIETARDGVNDVTTEGRFLLGGSWSNLSSRLESIYNSPNVSPDFESIFIQPGFRVAMVPEPSALSLLAVGLGALAMMRRRR